VRTKLLLLALAGVAALLVAELGLRTRAYLRSGFFGPAHLFVLDEASGLEIPVPGRDEGGLQNDSRGFRSPELEVPKPPGRVRLVYLGGSTTYCAEVAGNGSTWPARVVEGLRRAHPEVAFDWANAAAAGYTTQQSLVNLRHRVAGLDADVIVINHATNDLTRLTYELAEAQGLRQSGGDPRDWLSRWSYAWFLVRKNLLYLQRKSDDGAGSAQLAYDLDELGERFRASLTELVRAAKAEAPVVVLLTFTQRSRRGQPDDVLRANASSSLFYMPYLTAEGIRDAFVAFNDVIREVAAAEGAVLVDGEDEVPADGEHFADSVHLTAHGCEAQAARIVPRLEQAVDFPALAAAR
jgi:lysophospholipase L1-like esterase